MLVVGSDGTVPSLQQNCDNAVIVNLEPSDYHSTVTDINLLNVARHRKKSQSEVFVCKTLNLRRR